MHRNQIIEIDLAQQETKLILSDQNQHNENQEFKEKEFDQDQIQIQLNSQIVFYPEMNSHQNIQEKGEIFKQMDQDTSNIILALENNQKNLETNVKKTTQPDEACQKSFQSLLCILNSQYISKDESKQIIDIEQDFENKQRMKSVIFSSNSNYKINQINKKQKIKKISENKFSPKGDINNQIIEIESENENSQVNLIRIEEEDNIQKKDVSILSTHSNRQDLDQDNINAPEQKDTLTRLTSHKSKKFYTQTNCKTLNRQKDQINISQNKSLNKAIYISNSFDKKQHQKNIESFKLSKENKKLERNMRCKMQNNKNKMYAKIKIAKKKQQQTIISSSSIQIDDQLPYNTTQQSQKISSNQSPKSSSDKLQIENITNQMTNVSDQEYSTTQNSQPFSNISQQQMLAVNQVQTSAENSILITRVNEQQMNIKDKQNMSINSQPPQNINQSEQILKSGVNNNSNILNQSEKQIQNQQINSKSNENIINEISINKNQDVQIIENNKENIKNINDMNSQQQDNKIQDVIMVSPKHSRIQPQINLNDSCIIIQDNKLGKRIVKQYKNPRKQIIIKRYKQIVRNPKSLISNQPANKKKVIIKI